MPEIPDSNLKEIKEKTQPNQSLPAFGHGFLLLLLLLLIIGFLYTVRMFIMPVLLAAIFSGMFFPLYKRLKDLLRGRKSIASLLTCLTLLIALLLPVFFIADMVAHEAIDLYKSAEQKVEEILAQGDEGLLGKVKGLLPKQYVDPDKLNWQESLTDIAKSTGAILAEVINKSSRSTFQFVMNLVIILFTMFYFFQDGEKLVQWLKKLSPLGHRYEDRLIERFSSVSRATIKGALLLGLIQGALGSFLMWVFGVPSALLWGVLMVVLSIIPMMGAWLVLYPAAIYLFIIGDTWQGIAVVLITAVIISNLDNVLRPKLVGKDAKMHDLLIFFSTLGGIYAFGVMGFIIGPVIAALMLTLLDIYSAEFRLAIEHVEKPQDKVEPSEKSG